MDRLTKEEALRLYREAPMEELCARAQAERWRHVPERRVSYQIDRNVNYTNVCLSGCKFCNFHCRPDEPEKAYTLAFADYLPKIAELRALGGDQLLLQGGLHPKYGIDWYETLFRRLKETEPSLRLNALGPPEIAHIARISKLSYRDVLVRLRAAGLDTLPGAGAEILCDRVRRFLSPAKPTAQQWLDVMGEAHRLGMSTTATMVYGHIETLEERIDHLLALRELQDETGGFNAFIPLKFRARDNALAGLGEVSREETLRTFAIARLALDNIPHIKAYWPMLGKDLALEAMAWGADDLDGTINDSTRIYSLAGAEEQRPAFPVQELRQRAEAAGWKAVERDSFYKIIS
jgi:cyclic dehypoxanthinyl futalosine synthase